MSDLRQKIIETLVSTDGYRGLLHERQADAILSLPELIELRERDKVLIDALAGGTGFMQDGKRIDPADVYLSSEDLQRIPGLDYP